MELAEKLLYERKYHKLTKTELAQKLNQLFRKSSYSKNLITNLEEGIIDWDFNTLDEISYFFGLTISEFINKGWNLYNKSELDNIAYYIKKHFNFGSIFLKTTKNLSDLIQGYEIVGRKDWVSFPKYDIILKEYYDYTKQNNQDESNDIVIHSADKLLNKLEMCALPKDQDNTFPFIKIRGNVTYTSAIDNREPIHFLDLLKKVELSLSKIKEFFEEVYPYFVDQNVVGLKKLISYRQVKKIDYTTIKEELDISPETLSSWEDNRQSPKVKDLLKICNMLEIKIDLLSSNSLEIRNDINSRSLSEQLLVLSNSYDLNNFRNNYFFSKRKSTLLLPKSRYEKIYNHLEHKLTKEVGAKKAFTTMCEFIYKWYEFNRLRELLLYQLDGETFKTNVLMYTEEEIDNYLGEDLYPESPIKLLTQLVLHRVKKEHYTNSMKIIKENRDIDVF
ncbi:helix-turn-helix transcriptional regulator [Staphylococcus hominis]|uniref:helix-turn-helix domain-containing protein n=1 Tax=Staphylococcus hominis TaxID=1290 RepID=UPI001F561D6D|nr:helix-turn-helix transcriptional regulator [Staphylococcus hominis]MCI2889758.1 helix-turn-helix domain-containing protein [Staphylococcus hominis]MCI2893973.1 helix-turn-helix domain-containing protein [Staphylococcus hominis]MDS3868572.1 helix-turn-helix transcriptional regulator [Staphylococcus hominis]MDS3918823.1 helix-turn-helix transcriptional regulator [Staphylococcus hominis]